MSFGYRCFLAHWHQMLEILLSTEPEQSLTKQKFNKKSMIYIFGHCSGKFRICPAEEIYMTLKLLAEQRPVDWCNSGGAAPA
jgi:hypothetical protein